ncbi:hypothetical protein D9M68_662890 [compost metagenome]
MRLGLAGQQRIHADDGGVGLAFELRQEGAHRVNDREEFQLQFLAPSLIRGVGEGGDAALASVVDQDAGAPQLLFAGQGEVLHLGGVEHVADLGEQSRIGKTFAQVGLGGLQALRVATAESNGGAGLEQQLDASQADARGAAGDHRHGGRQITQAHGSCSATEG